MRDEPDIAGQQTHALFLRLHEQHFVKRVFVSERMRRHGCRMTGRQWQALTLAGYVRVLPFQPELLNSDGRHHKPSIRGRHRSSRIDSSIGHHVMRRLVLAQILESRRRRSHTLTTPETATL